MGPQNICVDSFKAFQEFERGSCCRVMQSFAILGYEGKAAGPKTLISWTRTTTLDAFVGRSLTYDPAPGRPRHPAAPNTCSLSEVGPEPLSS